MDDLDDLGVVIVFFIIIVLGGLWML